MNKGAIVLYSGGLDSTTVLASVLADPDYMRVTALFFDYGQTNKRERSVSIALADAWRFVRREVTVQGYGAANPNRQIPARNTIFLSLALREALFDGMTDVFVGSEPEDVYADSSIAYVAAMRAVFEEHGLRLHAPLLRMKSKADVLRMALDLGVPLDLVHPCRSEVMCFECRTCQQMRETVRAVLRVDWTLLQPACLRAGSQRRYGYDGYSSIENAGILKLLGYKQALSRLVRPRALNATLKPYGDASAVGPLLNAALDLGYRWSAGAGEASVPVSIVVAP